MKKWSKNHVDPRVREQNKKRDYFVVAFLSILVVVTGGMGYGILSAILCIGIAIYWFKYSYEAVDAKASEDSFRYSLLTDNVRKYYSSETLEIWDERYAVCCARELFFDYGWKEIVDRDGEEFYEKVVKLAKQENAGLCQYDKLEID